MSESLRPKSDEVLQVQVAGYISERSHPDSRADLTADLDAQPPKDYVSYLKEVGGRKHEPIAYRAELLGAYKDFKSDVQALKVEVDGLSRSQKKEHPAYLGKGSSASGFLIDKDGQEYVVRAMHRDNAAYTVESYVEGAFLSRGIPHLEQVSAISYEDGVTVSERMPGKEMGEANAEDIKAITHEQLGEFLDTYISAQEAGIGIDPKPSNIFYDREAGFGIIDVQARNDSSVAHPEVAAHEITISLRNLGVYGKSIPKTEEQYAQRKEIYTASLEAMKKFADVCAGRFEGEVRDRVITQLSNDIKTHEADLANYNNEEWVKQQIEAARIHDEAIKNTGEQALKGWATV